MCSGTNRRLLLYNQQNSGKPRPPHPRSMLLDFLRPGVRSGFECLRGRRHARPSVPTTGTNTPETLNGGCGGSVAFLLVLTVGSVGQGPSFGGREPRGEGLSRDVSGFPLEVGAGHGLLVVVEVTIEVPLRHESPCCASPSSRASGFSSCVPFRAASEKDRAAHTATKKDRVARSSDTTAQTGREKVLLEELGCHVLLESSVVTFRASGRLLSRGLPRFRICKSILWPDR